MRVCAIKRHLSGNFFKVKFLFRLLISKTLFVCSLLQDNDVNCCGLFCRNIIELIFLVKVHLKLKLAHFLMETLLSCSCIISAWWQFLKSFCNFFPVMKVLWGIANRIFMTPLWMISIEMLENGLTKCYFYL